MTQAPSFFTQIQGWANDLALGSKRTLFPQAIVIGTGQAGDPSQANQGAVLGFSVRAVEEQFFLEG